MNKFNEYECPHCKADLKGEPIPKDLRKMYEPDSTHYSRLIGIEIPELFDGISYYECPDCHVRWNRWTGEVVSKSVIRRLTTQKGKKKKK